MNCNFYYKISIIEYIIKVFRWQPASICNNCFFYLDMVKYKLKSYGGLLQNMEKEAKINLFDIIVYSMMVVAVIYIIIQTILGNNNELSFKITLGLWILAAVVISDFVEPLVKKVFDNIPFQRGMYYVIYSVFDAASYMSFYIFIINIGFTKEILHYVFLGLAVIFFVGRLLFRNMYEGYRRDETAVESDPDDFEVNTLNETEEDDSLKVLIYRNRNK